MESNLLETKFASPERDDIELVLDQNRILTGIDQLVSLLDTFPDIYLILNDKRQIVYTYMPRDIQLQIFQRSFSTKGSGRGLGTYSIKLLTERYLKGSVGFTSSEVGGTTFWAMYPLKFPDTEIK